MPKRHAKRARSYTSLKAPWYNPDLAFIFENCNLISRRDPLLYDSALCGISSNQEMKGEKKFDRNFAGE